MNLRRAWFAVGFGILTLAACGEPADPAHIGAPSFAAGGVGRPAVLVNPNANDNGTAKTIQEGIDMVAEGGTVMVLPGTYDEALVIAKGLTLEAIDGNGGPVVVAPTGTPAAAALVATSSPVTIRGLTVHSTGANGIRGEGVVDVTAERVQVLAVNPPLGASSLVAVFNDARTTGGRARLTVRRSFLDGTVPPANSPTPPFPQVFGIRVQGDVDALLEENVIRRTGGACIYVVTRNDFGGETNADILKNDLDECYPLQRQGSVLVIFPVVPTTPVTVTGVVNIVGNSIRNSSHSCLPTTAISQNFASGRIEHNRILDVVQPCATATNTRNPAALWIGSFSSAIPPVSPIVRFNDIEGNAHAGLRVAPNITTPLDTRCNWWGSAGGPAVGTDPPGSDIVLEAGAAAPTFMPFATTPIAETDATGC